MADQRPPLSDLQGKVLAYLVKFLQMNDQLPTNAKIAEAFGWASSNSADTHLKALEKKGYLARNELHHLMLADRPAARVSCINLDHLSEADLAGLRQQLLNSRAGIMLTTTTFEEVARVTVKPNPEMQSAPGVLRDRIHQNLAAMDTTVACLMGCVADDDAEYSLERCSDLMSQTRGLIGMLEAAVARGVVVSKEVAHG